MLSLIVVIQIHTFFGGLRIVVRPKLGLDTDATEHLSLLQFDLVPRHSLHLLTLQL
ncbi:MAG: hypothetical protein RLZ12_320 [Bacillota bacterium]|jgi:hypothetical protein